MQIRRLIQGATPLLISIPHMGTFLPPDIRNRLTPAALTLPDTDFHVDKLYSFAETMGIGILTSTHSRYVVDLNRDSADTDLYPGQVKTGLCPMQTFAGQDIYIEGEEPDPIERVNRIAAYWLPYHETLEAELQRLKAEFGYAILYDAHSIASKVPRLFDGQLPDLNLGTVNGASCAEGMAQAAFAAVQNGGYTSVLNGRFVGGYITRHYGRPLEDIHAVQMELSCINYMREASPFPYLPEKAEKLQPVLKNVLEASLRWGESFYAAKS